MAAVEPGPSVAVSSREVTELPFPEQQRLPCIQLLHDGTLEGERVDASALLVDDLALGRDQKGE